MKPSDKVICELCGRYGHHEKCEREAAESQRQRDEDDLVQLSRHALHGRYGVIGPESEGAFMRVTDALRIYLEREASFDCSRVVEADKWWFIPEGWIGMIGFIFEKETGLLYPLDSGLVRHFFSCSRPAAHWSFIETYLDGLVEPVMAYLDPIPRVIP